MAPEDLGKKGEFRLLSKIGEGGMADVFLAERLGDDGFKTRVALKRLHQGLAMDSYFIRQLVREARLLGQLEHANIVRVFDLRRIGDEYFVVMEYVDGIDLAAVIKVHRQRHTRVPLPFFFHVALSLLEALGYAHAAVDVDANPTPLIHRDIKPSNVMLSRRGVVKLTDFGIAHVGDGSVTGGMVQGTANYMSPEQAYGEEHLSPASDIYSLGVVFFEMLCGRPLVDGDNYLRAIQQVREQVISSEDLEALGVKPGLRMVVARMLSRDRTARYSDSDMVRNDLQFVADRLGINLSWHRIRAYVGRLMGILGRAPSRATLSNLKVQEDRSDAGFSSGSYGAESTLPPPFAPTGSTTPTTPAPVAMPPTSSADVTSAVRKDLIDLELSKPGLAPVSSEPSSEPSSAEPAAAAADGEDAPELDSDSTAVVDDTDVQGDDDEDLADDGGTTAGDTPAFRIESKDRPATVAAQADPAGSADWIEDDETAVYTGELPGLGAAAASEPDGPGSFDDNTDERTVPYVGQGPSTGALAVASSPERISAEPRVSGSFPPPPPSLTGEFRQRPAAPKPSPAVAFLPDGSEEGPTGTQVLGEGAEAGEEKTWVLTADVQQIAQERSAPRARTSEPPTGAAPAGAPADEARGRPEPGQGVRRRRKRRRKRKSQAMFLGIEKRTVIMAAIFSLVIGALLFFILAVLFVRSQQSAEGRRIEPDSVLVDAMIDEPHRPVQFLDGSCILARDPGSAQRWVPGPGITATSLHQGDIGT
jgi:serine/threonine protein kinase